MFLEEVRVRRKGLGGVVRRKGLGGVVFVKVRGSSVCKSLGRVLECKG